MDSAWIFVICVMTALIMLSNSQKRIKLAAITHVKRKNKLKKSNKEKTDMEELAKKFIGKDCVIYTVIDTSATITGVIKEVEGGGMLVESKKGSQIVNLEYVTRIREYPVNKKGKKVSVILD